MDSRKMGLLGNLKPLTHFVLALLLAGVGLLVSTIISFALLYSTTGSLEGVRSGMDPSNVNMMVTLQLVSQLIVFIIPAMLFSYLITKSPWDYFESRDKKNIRKYMLGVGAVVCAGFFIQCLVIDKASFVFPASLKFLEEMAKNAQFQYDQFVGGLLEVTNPLMLLLVFIMVAIMPALGEELLFRGMLQATLEKGFNNRWIAIFISGTFFGLIHFEFYNFFALCFMGYVLGYVYSITKNIYITILLHFINNGTAIVTMYLYKKNVIAINPEDEAPIYVVAAAGVFLMMSLIAFWKYFKSDEVADYSELQEL